MTASTNAPRGAVTSLPPIPWLRTGLVIIFLLALGLFVDPWTTVPLWLGCGFVLVLFYRGGGSLLGPVFFYDLVRTSRQGRHVVLRCAYAMVLLAVLFTVYASHFGGRVNPLDLFSTVSISIHELPQF